LHGPGRFRGWGQRGFELFFLLLFGDVGQHFGNRGPCSQPLYMRQLIRPKFTAIKLVPDIADCVRPGGLLRRIENSNEDSHA
jgi:hypothetical protein